jgi:hypothetical protein
VKAIPTSSEVMELIRQARAQVAAAPDAVSPSATPENTKRPSEETPPRTV